ncbi:hypothetical protein [Mycobacterium branderi]|uniref:hypothetical protein n=1 Tax=Mycobacterium branderi TaxID=43348 RepID=UPI003557E6F0
MESVMPRETTVPTRTLPECGMVAAAFVESLVVGVGQHAGHGELDAIEYAALPVNLPPIFHQMKAIPLLLFDSRSIVGAWI